jgi:lincosamide nucleotidyltransferase
MGRMIQHTLIAAVRAACAADPGLDAALMYGSFVKGEADAHSDVEFWLFFTPDARAATEPRAWIERLGHPVSHVLLNEFGSHVAFFPGLVRGEFHFATTAQIPEVSCWPERAAPADAMIVLDRSGRLRPALEALPAHAPVPGIARFVDEYCDPWANWLVLCTHLLRRGELLRTLDALSHAQRNLLWMARRAEDATGHWLTPSRAAETELSAPTLAALYAATAPADPERIAAALRAAFAEGRRHWRTLAARDPDATAAPEALFAELDAQLALLP